MHSGSGFGPSGNGTGAAAANAAGCTSVTGTTQSAMLASGSIDHGAGSFLHRNMSLVVGHWYLVMGTYLVPCHWCLVTGTCCTR